MVACYQLASYAPVNQVLPYHIFFQLFSDLSFFFSSILCVANAAVQRPSNIHLLNAVRMRLPNDQSLDDNHTGKVGSLLSQSEQLVVLSPVCSISLFHCL
jgi:hypothetical protein